MQGHLRKRGKDSWALVVDLGKDPETGKRRQQRQTVHGTKREAETELRKLLHTIETGGYVKPAKLTMTDFLGEWLDDYAATNTSPRTLEGYQGMVKRYLVPHIGTVRIEQLTPQHVQGLYARMLEKGLSPRTVVHTHRV